MEHGNKKPKMEVTLKEMRQILKDAGLEIKMTEDGNWPVVRCGSGEETGVFIGAAAVLYRPDLAADAARHAVNMVDDTYDN